MRKTKAVYYQDGASLRTLKSLYYQDGASLRLVWQAVPPLDGSISGVRDWLFPVTPTNHAPRSLGTLTAVPTGGSGTYTYQWSVTGNGYSLLNATAGTVTVRNYTDTVGVYAGTLTVRISDGSTYVDRSVPISLEVS